MSRKPTQKYCAECYKPYRRTATTQFKDCGCDAPSAQQAHEWNAFFGTTTTDKEQQP